MTDAGWLDVGGPAALPRRNGELAFDAPWQSRVFGMVAAVVELHFGGDREPFRRRLIAAVADQPDRSYWDSWAAAFELLLADRGLVSTATLDAAVASVVTAAEGTAPHPAQWGSPA